MISAQEFWTKLSDREKLEFLKLRAQQYPEYNDLSRNQFIDQFLEIWKETGKGKVSLSAENKKNTNG